MGWMTLRECLCAGDSLPDAYAADDPSASRKHAEDVVGFIRFAYADGMALMP